MQVSWNSPPAWVQPLLHPEAQPQITETEYLESQALKTPTCLDPLFQLFEVFRRTCPAVDLPKRQLCEHPEMIARLREFKASHIDHWVEWVEQVAQLKLSYVAGSSVRMIAGREYLEQQLEAFRHRLPPKIYQEVKKAIGAVTFPVNDVDLHFKIALNGKTFNPWKDLEDLSTLLIGSLEGILLKNQTTIIKLGDRPDTHTILLTLELHHVALNQKADLIFEVVGSPRHLFGADDLTLDFSEGQAIICSSHPYSYLCGQAFRILERKEPVDATAFPRLLLMQTLGYWAAPELIERCKRAAETLSPEERAKKEEHMRHSHLPLGLSHIVHQMNYSLAWEMPPSKHLEEVHFLTAYLALESRFAPAGKALLHLMAFIALLENSPGAALCGDQIKLNFPGGYALWFSLDVRPALDLLEKIDLNALRPLLKQTPSWLPPEKVDEEYAESVRVAIPPFPFHNLPLLLRLRLEAAIGPALGQEFWTKALESEQFFCLEKLLPYALQNIVSLPDPLMELLMVPEVSLRDHVRVLQRYQGKQNHQYWELAVQKLNFKPGSLEEKWRSIPGVDPQALVLWTGVMQDLKAQNIKALIAKKIDPPGGRVCLAVWFIHRKLDPLYPFLQLPEGLEGLMKCSLQEVCQGIRWCEGPFTQGSNQFVQQIIKHCLDQNDDPWDMWQKLGTRKLPVALRERWIMQEKDISRVAELLPSYSVKSPLRNHLRKEHVIAALVQHRRAHPWVFGLLLDGPLLDWPPATLSAVVAKLIEEGPVERRLAVIALYGEKLQPITALWKQLIPLNPKAAMTFTAVWLAQEMPLEYIQEMYIGAKQETLNLELLLQRLIDEEKFDDLFDLWLKVPAMQEKERFREFGKALFMKRNHPTLTTWALRMFSSDEAVLKRAAKLNLETDLIWSQLYPALRKLPLNGSQGQIAMVIIQHIDGHRLKPEVIECLCLAGFSREEEENLPLNA